MNLSVYFFFQQFASRETFARKIDSSDPCCVRAEAAIHLAISESNLMPVVYCNLEYSHSQHLTWQPSFKLRHPADTSLQEEKLHMAMSSAPCVVRTIPTQTRLQSGDFKSSSSAGQVTSVSTGIIKQRLNPRLKIVSSKGR